MRAIVAALLLSSALATAPARAQRAPLRLDIASAVRLALQRSPELGPGRAAIGGASDVARAVDTPLATPPRLEVQAGPRWRNDVQRYSVDATVALWQDFSLGGYGGARRDLARAMQREAGAGLAVAERDVAATTALAWIDARLARELMRIRAESVTDAVELVRLASARVRIGQSPPGEEALARAVLGSARAAALDAEGRRFEADAALGYVTGLPPAQPIDVTGALDTRDPPLDERRLLARARAAHPDVALARAVAARQTRTSEVARAGGKPYLSVGPLVTREGTGDWLFEGRVAVPLPLVNPAALESARARADARVAAAQARRVEARINGEIRMALHEREHAREVREALLTGAIAPAREALRQSQAQYEAGSGDLNAVLVARRALLDAEERWAEAAADVRRADVKLARALGREPKAMGDPNR